MNRTLLLTLTIIASAGLLVACQPRQQAQQIQTGKPEQTAAQPLPSPSLTPAKSLQTTVTSKTSDDDLQKLLTSLDSDMAEAIPSDSDLNDL